jgi:LPPG:FO 2-phospho-L-lactate transferase
LTRSRGPVVVLAGGTGGAKLARGMLDVVGAAELVVLVNPADDVEIYGAYVSPDPDLVTFWLGDRIDARGWGIEGDTFAVMDGLRELGVDVWFNLGDRDLALGLERARMLATGASPTAAHRTLSQALGVDAAVLPATDQPLRTWITAGGRPWPFQEFMIRHHAQGPIDDVAFRGAASARPTLEVLEAIRSARAIVIGPSNPIISIGPMLAIPGLRDALRDAAAPIVAVSPLVHGAVLKGPTAACLEWAGCSLDSAGILAAYAGLLDGLVADEIADGLPVLQADVLLDTPAARAEVAARTLEFALGLGAGVVG